MQVTYLVLKMAAILMGNSDVDNIIQTSLIMVIGTPPDSNIHPYYKRWGYCYTTAIPITELKKVPPMPYDGDSYKFKGWYNSICNSFAQWKPDDLDKIRILEANTIGAPIGRSFKRLELRMAMIHRVQFILSWINSLNVLAPV